MALTLLEQLANDTDWDVKAAVGRNPAAAPELLEQLVTSAEDIYDPHLAGGVLSAVGANPSTPYPLLMRLVEGRGISRDRREYASYRWFDLDDGYHPGAAANPSLPATTIATLAQARNPLARSAVCANPSAPADLLMNLGAEFLSQLDADLERFDMDEVDYPDHDNWANNVMFEPAWSAVLGLARNPATPSQLRQQLERVAQRLGTGPGWLLGDSLSRNPQLTSALDAGNPDSVTVGALPPWVAQVGAWTRDAILAAMNQEDFDELDHLARNPKSPSIVLSLLVQPEVLEPLPAGHRKWLKVSVASNPAAAKSVSPQPAPLSLTPPRRLVALEVPPSDP